MRTVEVTDFADIFSPSLVLALTLALILTLTLTLFFTPTHK